MMGAALRRPVDYLTGLSFQDNLSDIHAQGQIWIRYRVDVLEAAGFTIRRDGSQTETILPGTSLADIQDLIEPGQRTTLSARFPPGHVSVWTNQPEWLQWFRDENAAKQQRQFSAQTQRLFSLGEYLGQ